MLFRGEYQFLSNFEPCEVELDGTTYPTVEHAYQAAKTHDETERRVIAGLDSPGKAKRAGRLVEMRDDWHDAKVGIMGGLLRQKFHQDHYRIRLLFTEEEIIEENTWGDTFWGVCHGKGENVLGLLLTTIREELYEEIRESLGLVGMSL